VNTTNLFRLSLQLGTAVLMVGLSSAIDSTMQAFAQAEPVAVTEAMPAATSAAELWVEPADATPAPALEISAWQLPAWETSASASSIAQANQTPPTAPPQAPAPESPQPGAPPAQGDTDTTTPDTTSDDLTPSDPAPAETPPPAEAGQDEADETEPEPTTTDTDADTNDRTLGRATRTGPSYVGIGGNIGLGDGDTALGEGSFAVFSKVGVTNFLSVRPAVLFSGDNPTILVPVTFDFIPLVTDATEDVSGALGFRASPYVGAGTAISTGDDGSVDFLLSGGVDVPITSRFTATAAVNVSLFDNAAVGLLLGAGINF